MTVADDTCGYCLGPVYQDGTGSPSLNGVLYCSSECEVSDGSQATLDDVVSGLAVIGAQLQDLIELFTDFLDGFTDDDEGDDETGSNSPGESGSAFSHWPNVHRWINPT